MTAVLATQIELDARGVAWLAGTTVKVAEVVMDKLAHGWSPEEIHLQHPHLTLAQIHAAFAWYYENQEALDEQIAASVVESEQLARQLSDPAFRLKLAQRKYSR